MHLLFLLELGGGDLSVGLEDGDDEGDAEAGEGDSEEPWQGRLPNPRAGDGLRNIAGELHQVQGLVLNPGNVLLHLFFFLLLFLLLGRRRRLVGGWPGLVAGGLGAERGEGEGAPAGEEDERCRRKRPREGEGGGGAGMRAMEGEKLESRRHGHGRPSLCLANHCC